MAHKRVQDVLAYACLLNLFTFYSFYLPGMLLTEFSKSLPSSMVFSMSSFLIGFIARPIGSYYLGVMADRQSRIKGLKVSVILLGLASCLVCLVPDSEHWTYYVLRVVQGFALGGVYPILSVIIYESSPKESRGLYTGLFQTSVPAGYLFAIAVTIVSKLVIGDKQFFDYGWRVAFIYSILIFPIWWLLDRIIKQSDVDQELKGRPKTGEWTESEKKCVVFALLLATAIGSLAITGVNLKGFFLKSLLRLDSLTANHIIAYSTIFYAPAYALWGSLADRVGPLKVSLVALFAGVVFLFPLFKSFELVTGVGMITPFSGQWFLLFLISIGISLIATACFGPFVLLICRFMHPEHRCTLYGLAYNLSTGMVGGTAYLVSFLIYEHFDSIYGGIFYVIGVAVIAGTCAYLYLQKNKLHFQELK
ncbi:MFS transporter [Bdellovibrio sp. HCB209]|uniref:MFS transporter n=1 Tax=Bdellovibrio sp. HCB209 TaxID=3394354 RepID=UPI0039B58F59